MRAQGAPAETPPAAHLASAPSGNRKYLTARERLAFVYAASKRSDEEASFCLTLAFTDARIGEEERNLARRAWSSLELAIPE